jgi:hypothetical protein
MRLKPWPGPGVRSGPAFRRAWLIAGAGVLGLFTSTIGMGPAGASGTAASPGPAATHSAAVHHAPTASAVVSPRTAQALPAGDRQACAAPTRLWVEQCQLIVHSSKASKARSSATPAAPVTGSYGPSDLQAAYNLASAASANGTGTTVAIVDAYADPNLTSDLAHYRANYGLTACTTAPAPGCLTVLNQNGTASLTGIPADSTGGWEGEQALDVEMVSAICPNCNIVMYEANSDNLSDLGTAENTAAAKYKFVSNSWSGLFDTPGESFYDTQYFNHPGVVTAFASGDFGYGAEYPASSELVTSVGGTYLTMSNGARASETVWNDSIGATGSGCSAGEPKPSWQTDTGSSGCANRTENDVAAVASGPDGIALYDSYNSSAGGVTCNDSGVSGDDWCKAYGTSVATPIITSVYALAGTPAANTYPSQYLYQNSASTGFNRITSGSNVISGTGAMTCESNRQYLCNAGSTYAGSTYNGVTGWGTPNGVSAFAAPTTQTVSVINPGTYDLEAGINYTLPAITAYDSAGSAMWLYSATGLPSGMSINSSTGSISGAPSAPGSSSVAVTVSDGTVSTTVTFNIVAAPSLDAAYHPGTGPVRLDLGGKCMDDTGNSSNNGTKIQIWACNGGGAQNWTFYPDTDPGDAGQLTIHNKCLDIVNGGKTNGTKLQLWACNGNPQQQWFIVGSAGELYSPYSGKCAEDPYSSTTNGRQLDIWDCNLGTNQAWTLPASPVLSGLDGKCLDDRGGSSANGTVIQSYACNGLATQKWTVSLNGQLEINGKCVDATGYGTVNGTEMQLYACNNNPTIYNQIWVVTGTGQLENLNAQKCLAIPGNLTVDGTQLQLQDCYGQPGEIWAES